MKIISYKTSNFAGLRDVFFDFVPASNILLGPNEAGKTTVIDGIYHSLFTPAKLRKNIKQDKDFISKYFSQGSDSIDGQVEFEIGGLRYTISKLWSLSDQSREKLTLPDGSTLTSQAKVSEKMRSLLVFGPATYKYLNFPSHGDKNEPLFNLSTNEDIKSDISGFLTRTVMELDGLSLENLEANINARLDSLGARWDFDRNLPQNNRGIDNKYEIGLGQILKAYYKKEDLKRSIRLAYQKEEAFQEASDRLKAYQEEYTSLKKEKDSLDLVAEDIRKRSNYERDLEETLKKSDDLRLAMVNFPKFQADFNKFKKDLEEKNKEGENLQSKLSYIEKRKRKLDLETSLEKYGQIAKDLEILAKEIQNLGQVDRVKLAKLKDLDRQVAIEKAKLSAENIKVSLDIKDKDSQISLKDGLGKEVDQPAIGSYFKLEAEGLLELEVSLSDLDIKEIKNIIDNNYLAISQTLEGAGVKTLDEFEKLVDLREGLEGKRLSLEKDLTYSLGGAKAQDLIEELEGLRAYTEDIDPKEVQEAQERLNKDILTSQRLYAESKYRLEDMTSKYGSVDKIFDLVAETGIQKKFLEDQLNGLAKLPPAFASPDEFFYKKSLVDKDFASLNSAYFEAKDAYNTALGDLPEVSVEEMQVEYGDGEEKFTRLLKEYEDLSKIRDIYYQTLEESSQNPMKGLEESMAGYLNKITKGSISLRSLEDKISLEGRTTKNLGYYHLSKGSKDSVALAFRLALVENLFSQGTFIAFDDVFNDLDEERKIEAAELLRQFSKNNQIIFASFDPYFADLLDAHIIPVG